MRIPRLPNHEGCYIFEVDFDTKKVICEPCARWVLGDGSVVRLVFTPSGFKMAVSQDAIDSGHLIITPKSEDQLEYVGTPK